MIGRARPQTVFADQIVHPAPDETAVTHKASLRCPPGVVLAAVSFALAGSVFAYLAAKLL